MKLLDSGFIDRSKIKRPSKYQRFHQNLSDEDLGPMEDDIEKNGQKEPVTLDQDYNLLDGYTRDDILGSLKQKEILYTRYEFASEAEKLAFIKSANRNRRHLSLFQKCQWGKVVYEKEKLAAAEREKRGTLASPDARGKAVEKAADVAGVSPSTFERFLEVDASPLRVNRQKDLESGKLAIKTAANMVKLQKNHEKPVKLAKGIFNCIVEDAPFRFDNGPGIRGSSDLQYPTLRLQKICNIKMPAAQNCVYFEWISTSMKHDTQTVTINGKEFTGSTLECILKARGAKSVSEFILPKKKPGKGSYNFSMHETCIMAFKGKMPLPAKRFPSVLPVFDGEHSEKPDIFYDWVRQMYPKCKRYAPFERKQRAGFVCGGNQLKICKKCDKFHSDHNAGPEDCICKCHNHIVLVLTIKDAVHESDIMYEFRPVDKKLPLASPIWSGICKDNRKAIYEVMDRVRKWYKDKFNRTVIVETKFARFDGCPKCRGVEGKGKIHVVINSKICGIVNVKHYDSGTPIICRYKFSKDLKSFDHRAGPGISSGSMGGGTVADGPINAIERNANWVQQGYKRPVKIQVVDKF